MSPRPKWKPSITPQEYRLLRTGQPALFFVGIKLGEIRGVWWAKQRWTRRYEFSIYKTTGQSYVVGVEYITDVDGEPNRWHAYTGTPNSLVSKLRNHDVEADILGYPPERRFRERQARLVKGLRQMFDDRVSRLFDVAPGLHQVVTSRQSPDPAATRPQDGSDTRSE